MFPFQRLALSPKPSSNSALSGSTASASSDSILLNGFWQIWARSLPAESPPASTLPTLRRLASTSPKTVAQIFSSSKMRSSSRKSYPSRISCQVIVNSIQQELYLVSPLKQKNRSIICRLLLVNKLVEIEGDIKMNTLKRSRYSLSIPFTPKSNILIQTFPSQILSIFRAL
jgi:hypothetical protein